jgi:hypothetical protein
VREVVALDITILATAQYAVSKACFFCFLLLGKCVNYIFSNVLNNSC